MEDLNVIMLGIFVKKEKTYSYTPGTDGKKSSVSMAISVRDAGGKKDENGYPVSTLWFAKAFGNTADFIEKYMKDGDAVKCEGTMQKTAATEKYPERTEIIVNEANFLPQYRNKKDGTGTAVTYANKGTLNMGVPKAPAASATGTSGGLW